MRGRTGQCAACSHVEAHAINESLVRGVSAREVAHRFKLKPGVIARHKKEHVPKVLALDQEEKAAAAARSLKDIFNSLFERLESVIKQCEAAGDWRAVLVALREQREWVQDAVKMQTEEPDPEANARALRELYGLTVDDLPNDALAERPQLPAHVEPVTERVTERPAEAEPLGAETGRVTTMGAPSDDARTRAFNKLRATPARESDLSERAEIISGKLFEPRKQ